MIQVHLIQNVIEVKVLKAREYQPRPWTKGLEEFKSTWVHTTFRLAGRNNDIFEGFVLTIHSYCAGDGGGCRMVMLKLSSKYFSKPLRTSHPSNWAHRLPTTEEMLEKRHAKALADVPMKRFCGGQLRQWMLTAVSEDKECSQESQYTPLSQFFIDVVEQGPAQLLGERPLQRFAGLGLDPHG